MDWPAITQRAVEDLQTLLRFDTRNPPGDERPAIDWIAAQLADEGLDSEILEHEGRPNLVARIEGDGSGGGPLLLAGHVDVVPVEVDQWTVDPFAGEIHDGYLFGRGAIDMKHMVTHCLTAMRLAARTGAKPSRDIIFAAVADEETGCEHGSKFLVEEHPDKVRADYMLGEFGGFSMDVGDLRVYPIQVAERGNCKMKIRVRGTPGHGGSVPHGDQAVVKLAKAIAKLGTKRLPLHPTRTTERFFAELAELRGGVARHALPQLTNPLLSNVLLDFALPDKNLAANFAAAISNTVSPTILEAGQALNVIPGEATAYLDGRLIPGQTDADLVREVRSLIGPEFDIEVILYAPGREGTTDDPLYDLICDTVRKHDPTGHPVPYLLAGFTDAMYFGRIVEHCYGFAPIRFPAEDEIKFSELVHGHDERIHVDGFRWGVHCFWDVVAAFTGLA